MRESIIYRLERDDEREVAGFVDEVEHLVILSRYSFDPFRRRIDNAASRSEYFAITVSRMGTN